MDVMRIVAVSLLYGIYYIAQCNEIKSDMVRTEHSSTTNAREAP